MRMLSFVIIVNVSVCDHCDVPNTAPAYTMHDMEVMVYLLQLAEGNVSIILVCNC